MTAMNAPSQASESARGEMIYFVMLDRFFNGDSANDDGGLGKDSKISGLNKSNNGFYHGGDIAGLEEKIPYIKSLGFTAIWITPVVRQLSVAPDGTSASYHGYWGAGFDEVDPHLGTMEEFKKFVAKAHDQELKVILDIVVNHTADAISYANGNSYVSEAEAPYKDINGKRTTLKSFIHSKKPILLDAKKSFPKTPFVYPINRSIKSPQWLNDITNYHNRGDSTFAGESSFLGDFFGLDDLFTEKPEVLKGFTNVYSDWITKTGIDGFRIDTARHVNPEFWQSFLPAMRNAAAKSGKTSFPMWGEIYDTNVDQTSYWIKNASFTEVLDFPLQDRLINFVKNRFAMPLATIFNDDDLYIGPGVDVNDLGTFLGNHDMGRVGSFIGLSQGSDIALKQVQLAHALLFSLRGTPIVYYGDEFGLMGGSDKDARQDLFATEVPHWQTEPRIGQDPIGSKDSFSTINPLQKTLKELTSLRASNDAIASGGQKIRYAGGGIFSFSRGASQGGSEYLFVFNANDENISQEIQVDADSDWNLIAGTGEIKAAQQKVIVDVPSYSWVAFRSASPVKYQATRIDVVRVRQDPLDKSRLEIVAKVDGTGFFTVNFLYKNKLGRWVAIGQDQSPTFSRNPSDTGLYRTFPKISELSIGRSLQVKAEIKTAERVLSSQIKSLVLKK